MDIQCCKCRKYKHIDGRGNTKWRREKPTEDSKVSHGYCPKCAEEAFAEIEYHHSTDPDKLEPAVE